MGALGVQGQRLRRKILRLGTREGDTEAALRRVGAAHRALKEAACWANGQSPSPAQGQVFQIQWPFPVADVLGKRWGHSRG